LSCGAADRLFLNLDAPAAGALVLTLLVGTPALTFIGLIGARSR
jgi:CcmB protein.